MWWIVFRVVCSVIAYCGGGGVGKLTITNSSTHSAKINRAKNADNDRSSVPRISVDRYNPRRGPVAPISGQKGLLWHEERRQPVPPKYLYCTYRSQTGPGAHPASCTMGTGPFPGVKRPRRGADHPPPSKRRGHERVELYLALWAFVACYRENLYLHLTYRPGRYHTWGQ